MGRVAWLAYPGDGDLRHTQTRYMDSPSPPMTNSRNFQLLVIIFTPIVMLALFVVSGLAEVESILNWVEFPALKLLAPESHSPTSPRRVNESYHPNDQCVCEGWEFHQP